MISQNNTPSLKVRIFLSYHQPAAVVENEYLSPIQVGAASSKNIFCDTRDDIGADNISEKNSSFCELTAQYWAWKNCDADFIGFMHYRRHLDFDIAHEKKEDIYGVTYYEKINKDYLEKIKLTKEGISDLCSKYDLILPKKWNVNNANSKNNYTHYKESSPHLHIKDYDLALKIVKEKYPEYTDIIEKYNNSNLGYYTNMFVMKNELFKEYSEWLFSILFELERQSDITKYNKQEKRIFGYISEWLFGIFITHHISATNLRYIELQRTFIRDTAPEEKETLPAFKERNVAIAIAFGDSFSAYGGALIKSIITAASSEKNYDILILDGGISEENKRKLINLADELKNFSIRFIHMDNYFKNNHLPVHMHFGREIYFRLKLPSIFSTYDKILYIDADVIVLKDIADLYELDLTDHYAAAVSDYVMKGFRKLCIRSLDKTGGLKSHDYLLDYVGMKNPENYFQSGVMLFNTAQLRKEHVEEKLITEINKKIFWFPDQDILNLIFETRVLYLDYRWNVLHGNGDLKTFYTKLPCDIFDKYMDARKNPYVVHYAGEKKPWLFPDIEFADYFWKFITQTPWKSAYSRKNLRRKNALATPELRMANYHKMSKDPGITIYRKIRKMLGLWRYDTKNQDLDKRLIAYHQMTKDPIITIYRKIKRAMNLWPY